MRTSAHRVESLGLRQPAKNFVAFSSCPWVSLRVPEPALSGANVWLGFWFSFAAFASFAVNRFLVVAPLRCVLSAIGPYGHRNQILLCVSAPPRCNWFLGVFSVLRIPNFLVFFGANFSSSSPCLSVSVVGFGFVLVVGFLCGLRVLRVLCGEPVFGCGSATLCSAFGPYVRKRSSCGLRRYGLS
jgi:hypothetical protein